MTTTRHPNADRIIDMLVGYSTDTLTFDTLARLALATSAEPGTRTPPINATDLLRLVLGVAPVSDDLPDSRAEQITGYVAQTAANLNPYRVNDTIRATLDGGYRLLTPTMPDWPTGLSDLGEEAPLILWTRGNTDTLTTGRGFVAVTGARASTGYGEHVAAELTTALTEHRFRLVNGASYGIEGAAARASLATGSPVVAVLASGIDRAYPVGHADLLESITTTGVTVSEYPPGSVPTRDRFIRRGRIIAALATAVVIVEAGYRSGALTLATHALALRRVVAAIPGPVTSAASAGCHRLIQDGETHLITTGEEVVALIDARPQ